MSMSISNNILHSDNYEKSSISHETEAKRIASSDGRTSTCASDNICEIPSSEKSNEALEWEDYFMPDEKGALSELGSKESIFSEEKYFRLEIEGPLTINFEADPGEIPLNLPVEHTVTPLVPSHEGVPDETEVNLDPINMAQEGEVIELGKELAQDTMADGILYPNIELLKLHPIKLTQEQDFIGLNKGLHEDPLAHGIIYPDLELLLYPPLPLDYYKTFPDEENVEFWATSSYKVREEIKGTLSFHHLKEGLSKFSYEVYGFTALNVSGKFLTDISLFARLPMTFSALTHVNLSQNKLADISALSGIHSITHLDVSHNKLKKLLFLYPEWHWNVDEPGKMDIDRNVSRCTGQLSSSGWALCGVGISQLRWVNYSHNVVRSLEGPRHWAHFPHLAYLDLSHNHISDMRSEDPVLISGGAEVHSDIDKGSTRGSTAKCGLASLTLLHTLNISNNFISHVGGLNGLCVHNLILSNNAICNWEGETGQLYEESRYTSVNDGQDIDASIEGTTTDSLITPPVDMKGESLITSAESNYKFDGECSGEGGKISISEEHSEPLPIPEILIPPTIRVTKTRCVEGNGTRANNHEVDSAENQVFLDEDYSSSKTVEVLFTEADRKKEKVTTEVLYQSKKPDSNDERSSEDVSVMESCYFESNGEGDYTTRRRRLEVLHSPKQLKNSEEDQSDTGWGSIGSLRAATVGSASCRISQASGSPRMTFLSGGDGDEVLPDFLSISSMFDYDWEGYQPDDQCFAKVWKGKKAPERRRTTVRAIPPVRSTVEVLYQRESLSTWAEGSGEGESGGDSEVLVERAYEEWDDPEVHVLLEARLEPDSDYESRSIEVFQVGAESEERVKVLYRAECSEGLLITPGLEDSPEDGMELLFERSGGHLEALVEPAISGSKSVEVLFRRDEQMRESCIGLDEEEDEMSGEEERGKGISTIDRLAVFFDVYEPAEMDSSEEASEVHSEVGELKSSTDESALERSESDGTPEKIKVDLPGRVNANKFKEFVGIRSLKWLTELHLESNKIMSLKMLRGVYSLRSLFLQENFIEDIGEIMYLSELHQLEYLDMTDNPVCNIKEFYETTIFIVPSILYLNQVTASDFGAGRSQEIIFHKNPFIRASRLAQDILFASEMRRVNHLPWSCPELDSLPYMHSPYPVLLLVGPEGSRNKELCQALSERLPEKVYMSKLVTTKPSSEFKRYVSSTRSEENHGTEDSKEHCEDPTSSFQIYHTVTEEKFLELLSSGSFACVTDDDGFLFGFDKCDAIRAAQGGKVLVAAVNLTSALVLHLAEFCGKPRLVLILPESVSLHEKNLRRERRGEALAEDEAEVNQLAFHLNLSDCKDSGCDVGKGLTLSGNLLAEHEFVRRNLEARQACLTVHHNNPEVFHCGVFSDCKELALGKLTAIVDEMYDRRRSQKNLRNESGEWYGRKSNFSKDIDDLINARLERELRCCMSVWE